MSGNENANDRWVDSNAVLRGFELVARNDNKARLLEAELLRAAERLRTWVDAGCVSLTEMLERMLGWGPKKARERIRVARALEHLPELTAALAASKLQYSTVRELTRIATPETEREWIEKVRGKILREVEQEVSGRKRGSSPNDPPDPDLKPRVLRYVVDGPTAG